MCTEYTVSSLAKTWLLDLDGTLLKHNGYKTDGKDTMLPGAKALLDQIAADDMVVVVTSRKEDCREATETFLKENGVRYDHIIFEAPYGERILINDDKPSGLAMAVAVRVKRNELGTLRFNIDNSI